MRPVSSSLLFTAFLLLPFAATAQDKPAVKMLTVAREHRVTVPPRWTVQTSTPLSLEIFIPAEKRRFVPEMGDKNPKPARLVGGEASMLIVIEPRRSHEEAVRRLEEIASERPEDVRKVVIDGWPAIDRTYRAPMPLPGETDPRIGTPLTLFHTTAIASGSTVVRCETTLQPDADPKIADEAAAIGRTYHGPQPGDAGRAESELNQLRVRLPKAEFATPDVLRAPATAMRQGRASAGTAVNVQAGLGELEVVSSLNGANVVVAVNSGFSFSANSGASWMFGGGTPCNQTVCDGDPSVALGNSGAFYYAWIGGPSGGQLGDGISRSTDNGQTFPFRAMAVNCPGTSACVSADQEHIAADRVNAGASGDRVYNVWRNFTSTSLSVRIVCSSDGAATWGTQQVVGAGDFPRVSVGGDGSVYVAFASGGNLMLNKYAPCDASNNLAQVMGWPITAVTSAAFANVVCPVPGLDRCNGRNILSSPRVAVDDLDPNHLYYVYATSTGAGNEDIIVRDSVDAGQTFPRAVRVNANVTGRRFMPWISSFGGVATVSWYDRRTATAASNDNTRFFIGTAKPNGGTLVALGETDLSGNDDHECSTWPCATNAPSDATSCSAQPQLAGRCSIGGAPCDFNLGCGANGTCNFARGCPKYGDYNGNAAMGGRLFSAWASAVAPVGATAPGAGINVYTSTDLVPSDFFVRDWTNNASSHDDGSQPSTNPTFWTTSDVWSQSVSTVESPVNDWILGDPPSRSAPNFAFARVSRRVLPAATAPPATVTVNFSFADFGANIAYAALGSETVLFAPGDLTQFTPGHSWTVPATASSHLCLVAEIDGPGGDLLAPPSVVGLSPGAGISLITIDNNKAQRNLQGTVGTAGGTSEMFAMVRNDRKERRDVTMIVATTNDAIKTQVHVVGGETFTIAGKNRINVGSLDPNEIRWLQVRVTRGDAKQSTRIDFADDIAGGGGFSILATVAPVESVAASRLRAYGDVMLRLAEIEKNDLAKREAGEALKLDGNRVDPTQYRTYLRKHAATINSILKAHLSAGRPDTAGIGDALKQLNEAIKSADTERELATHNALTERLDADLSMLVHR